MHGIFSVSNSQMIENTTCVVVSKYCFNKGSPQKFCVNVKQDHAKLSRDLSQSICARGTTKDTHLL